MSTPPSKQPSCEASGEGRVLYCHCAYAKVVPEATKAEVLQRLSDSDIGFDAVPDLCEMSARRDPALTNLAGGGDTASLKIAACFPRAVKWLFHAAGTPLNEDQVEVVNMRELSGTEVAERLLGSACQSSTGQEATP
ncbi:MAG: hypothetical protein VX951_14550 [Planctomycetota bacterium]|nr:hypothetical protein [Planctomycetota bacterium]